VAGAARAPAGDGPREHDLRLAHARCLIALGRHDDAEAELESIYDGLAKEPATPGDRRADDVVKMIVECLVASGREDEAAEWRERIGQGR
jgi:hypothetical protein